MGMRRTIRALAGAAAAVMMVAAAPVGASAGRASAEMPLDVAPDLGIRLRMLRQLEELKAPHAILDALTDQDAARIQRGRSVAAYPMRDVTGDGVAEVFEFDVRYSYVIGRDSQSLNTISEQEFTTNIRFRNGRTGRLQWKKRYDDFVVPARANVGRSGRPGVIAIGGILTFFGGSPGDRYLTFEGLAGKTGKRLWSKRYMSVMASHDYTTSVVTDSPVSFAFVQARKDRPTEILLGLSNITQAMFTTTAATRAVLLSAEDGNDSMHPHVDVGVDWLPFPDAVHDLDGDGLHDYVVINDKGLDPGEGQDTPRLGGIIQARRGADGASVWTRGGFEFRYFAFTIPFANVVGDARRDFGIFTLQRGRATTLLPSLPLVPSLIIERHREVVMLVDAGGGNVRWTKPAWWAHSPGDVDRDGRADVVLDRLRYNRSINQVRYSRVALSGRGTPVWRHDLTWRGEPCLAHACLGGAALGLGSAGDVHPDRVADRFVWLGLFQPPQTEDYATFVVEGDSDKTLIRSDETLMPLGAAVDAKGSDVMNARVDRHRATFKAREGSSGAALWSLQFSGAEQLLPKRTYAFGEGFALPGDRCGDVVVNLATEDSTLYAVVDGADAKLVWSRWIGKKGERPRLTRSLDLNRAC